MSINKQRIGLMRIIQKIGRNINLSQKESFQMQIIDEFVIIIINDIVTNPEISENTILALTDFLSVIESTINDLEKENISLKEIDRIVSEEKIFNQPIVG